MKKLLITSIVFFWFLFSTTYSFLSAAERPWWDSFPRIIQVPDVKTAIESNADVLLCGAADDPCWGLFSQQERALGGKKNVDAAHDAGMHVLVWFEGFGTTQENVVQFKKNADGTWYKNPNDPNLTLAFKNHWGWQTFDGKDIVRWVGISNYFYDDPAVAPWTRSDSGHNCPPMRYPDGRIAKGFVGIDDAITDFDYLFGPDVDPRTSRVFDAGASKNVLGEVFFEYDYNRKVNTIDPETKQPVGPITGLVKVDDIPLGPPDPGFTPEEWKTLRRAGYSGLISAGKDSACPVWIAYLKGSLEQAMKCGADGLWVDNFSPWDSFNAHPILKAFGEWSVVGFREYLKKNENQFSREFFSQLDLATFDVRAYMRDRCKEWGGEPTNLSDPYWRDPRWQDDPIWRAYLIYKRQTGTAALTTYYETIKRIAAENGKPDFLVSGNDIPVYSLGWVRGNLDMVSTELSWGWGLTTGPRGIMPPPNGAFVPIYRLGREHAKSRFINLWLYVPEEQIGKPNIAKVLYYQGLANHALPMPQSGKVTCGNVKTDGEFYKFVEKVEPIYRDREPLSGNVAVYYSSSSQMMEMLPGGFKDHNRQPYSFAIYGWGTALCKRQIPWKPILEWKLNRESLNDVELLILPNVDVIEDENLATLQNWVSNGGRLIYTGDFAKRKGETGNFEPRTDRTGPLFVEKGKVVPLGKGTIFALDSDVGYDYYLNETKRPEFLAMFDEQIALAAGDTRLNPYFAMDKATFPVNVDITAFRDANKLFFDISNTNIDVTTDQMNPSGPVAFTVKLPKEFQNRDVKVKLLFPEEDGSVELLRSEKQGGTMKIELSNVPFYCGVVIE